MKAILDQGELDGDSMEIEDFWEAFHEWICQVRSKFPGISTEQTLRCEKLAFGEAPVDDARQAAVALAVIKQLEASGAQNLVELDEEHLRKLAADIDAIPKTPRN
jgi:hypothetical protein